MLSLQTEVEYPHRDQESGVYSKLGMLGRSGFTGGRRVYQGKKGRNHRMLVIYQRTLIGHPIGS